MNTPELAKLTPNSPPDMKGVQEVIALLSDSAAVKERLQKLTNEMSRANSTIMEARALAERTAAGEQMMSDATALLAQHAARTAEVTARESAVDAREQVIMATEADYQTKAAELDARDVALTGRERQHETERTAWQASVAQTQSELAATREDLKRRADLLRSVAAGARLADGEASGNPQSHKEQLT